MSKEGLDALRARIHGDPAFARRLHAISPRVFAAEATRVAAESGIEVTQAELDDAAARGRQAWIRRWTQ